MITSKWRFFSHLKIINETCMVGDIASLLPKLDNFTHTHNWHHTQTPPDLHTHPSTKRTPPHANGLGTPANGDFLYTYQIWKNCMVGDFGKKIPHPDTQILLHNLEIAKNTTKQSSNTKTVWFLFFSWFVKQMLWRLRKELINKIISHQKFVFKHNKISKSLNSKTIPNKMTSP